MQLLRSCVTLRPPYSFLGSGKCCIQTRWVALKQGNENLLLLKHGALGLTLGFLFQQVWGGCMTRRTKRSRRPICLLIVCDFRTASCELLTVFTEKWSSYIGSHMLIQSCIHLTLFIEHLLFARHSFRCWGASSQQNHKDANFLMAGTQLTWLCTPPCPSPMSLAVKACNK